MVSPSVEIPAWFTLNGVTQTKPTPTIAINFTLSCYKLAAYRLAISYRLDIPYRLEVSYIPTGQTTMAAYDDFLQLHLSFWLSTVDIQFRMRINRTLNILVKYIIIGYDHFFRVHGQKKALRWVGYARRVSYKSPVHDEILWKTLRWL